MHRGGTTRSNGGNGGTGGNGGSGVDGTGFTLTNSAAISGGEGGAGGLGRFGANGGNGGNGGNSGAGGSGVSGTGFAVINSSGGTIAGGNGGAIGVAGGGTPVGTNGLGGNGGTGISGSGFTLTNNGSVVGGNGSESSTSSNVGAGGVGIIATGNAMVINAGTISGGKAGVVSVTHPTGPAFVVASVPVSAATGAAVSTGTQVDAIDFSGGGNTLVIEAGSIITGNVVSRSGATHGGDTLALGGSTNATGGNSFDLAQLGAVGSSAQYQGFNVFEKTGSSLWSLTGTTTAVSAWSIDQGTLSLTGNAALGATSTMTVNASGIFDIAGISGSGTTIGDLTGAGSVNLGAKTLTLGTSNNTTFAGVLSGSGGSVVKQGSGTLILNGINTATGVATVDAGTLEVGDAEHATAVWGGNVTVNTGGTLRGHGTIDGNVTSDGTVWPGGSMGVLTINGNYTQNADGTLQIDLTPTQASQLVVNGTASLAGTLDLIYAPGTYSNSTYTLVQAKNVSGTFATVNSTGTGPAQVTYTGTQANLVLTTTATPPTTPTSPVRVAPRDAGLYGNLLLTQNLTAQRNLSSVLDASLLSRAPSCQVQNASSSACQDGLWMQSTGSSLSVDGSSGVNATGFGLLAGADRAVGDVIHLGVEAGVGQTNATDPLGGSGRVQQAHAGVYAFADAGPLVLSATADVAHNSYRVSRETGIGHAVANPDGNATSAGVQAAWPMQLVSWQVVPKLGALYQHQSLDGFDENLPSNNPLAPAFTVQGSRSTANTLQPYAAVSFTNTFRFQDITYVPQFNVGYRYNTRSNSSPTVQMTSEDGTVFAQPGVALGRGLGTVGARITAEAGASWNVYLDYQGMFASHMHDNALTFGFTKHF
ncbi:autotransporter outer membrane beta-barrel domain-containing protein [Dyella terrae]|uniref:autotransporter outer membrane beta-barrel domain-containing protein n=1 Tax=Dyella terrae TaxID=522259 RepID=UPI001EFE699A|nr:autotransporter outer membrane beta-barrel domain-containing protein [Dyella terrae]ULU23447.1 autotransporter-associated beta strand repeat-containing protein [Dyella terrae]